MHNIHDIKLICSQNVLCLKCNVKWGTQNTKFKVVNQHKTTCVMCSSWKWIFILVPLALLTVFSPMLQLCIQNISTMFHKSLWVFIQFF
jgi:hypothetical protein